MAARPAMAVPPAKGLDEVWAWLHKAALTPFPPVTKLSRTTVTERTRLGRELNCYFFDERGRIRPTLERVTGAP